MRALTPDELAQLDPAKLRRPDVPNPTGEAFTLLGGKQWKIPAPKLTADVDSFPEGPRVPARFNEGAFFDGAADAFAVALADGSVPSQWKALAIMAAHLLTRNYRLTQETAMRLLPFGPTDDLAELMARATRGDREASKALDRVRNSADRIAEHVAHGPARRMAWVNSMQRGRAS